MFLWDLNIMDKLPLDKLPTLPTPPEVDLGQPTWDLFIYMFFGIAVLLFGFTLGRQRIVSILISVYLSLVIVDHLPYLNQTLGDVDINLGVFAFKLSSFAVIFIIAFIVFSRSAILHEMAGPGRGIVSAFIFSFLFIGLMVSIILSFLPQASFDFLSPFTREIFTSDLAKFVWLVLPLAAMAVLRGRED